MVLDVCYTSVSTLDGSQTVGLFQRESGGSQVYQAGQAFGDVVTVIQVGVETVAGAVVAAGGGALTIVSGGTASPVTVPATAAGVTATQLIILKNLR